MARVSRTRRLAAALAALAMACALLAPPPSLAAPGKASDAPLHEIGSGVSDLVGALSGTTKRGAESALVALRLPAAPERSQPPVAGRGNAPTGGEAPALVRWRLAHGTSTASP